MQRILLRVFLVVGCLSFAPTSALAEWYGYGGWGIAPYAYWGGGETVQGSILRGMGYYLNGAGQYNLMTAQARSINVETWITWNEYVSKVQENMAKRYSAHVAATHKKHLEAARKHCVQLRDNPSALDVREGNALNLKVRLLTMPAYAPVVYDQLSIPLSKELVESIPFTMPSKGVSLAIEQLSTEAEWPAVLQSEEFTATREAVQSSLKRLTQQAMEGKNTQISSGEALTAITALHKAILESKAKDKLVGTYEFVTSLDHYARALGSTSFLAAINEIRATPDLTLGKLLEVMDTNRLMFSVASTPKQRALYERLYVTLQTAPTLLDEKTVAALMAQTANYCN